MTDSTTGSVGGASPPAREERDPGDEVRAADARAAALAERIAQLDAALENLRRSNEILSDRVDRLSERAARRAIAALRRAVSPRRFALEPVPVAGLVRDGAGWRSSDGSARFHLRHGTNRYPNGWVEVEVEIAAEDGDAIAPVLRALEPEGRGEVTVPLPPLAGGRARGLVRLPDRVRDLALHPSDRAAAFRLGALTVREVASPAAGARLAATLAVDDALRPRRIAAALGGGWRALRGGGLPGLSRAFRDAALAARDRAGRDRGPGVALLTYRLATGFGVDVVVVEQLEYLCARGYHVTAIALEVEDHFRARLAPLVNAGRLRVVRVRGPEEAAAEVRARGIRIAIAETPPFFEALALLPETTVRVIFDHGEPPAHLFEDAAARRAVAARKVEISARTDLNVAISRFIRDDSGLAAPELCPNGNDHLLRRRSNLARLAGTFRARLGLGDAFVVLNVTRYLAAERRYKGLDAYAAVRDALLRLRPDLAGRVTFVVAGRSEPADRAWAEGRGLVAASNLDEDALVAAYLDADLYLTTSQWEGCNLGLTQALALGLPSLASAQGAHPELPVRTSDDPEVLAREIAGEVDRAPAGGRAPLQRLRTATVQPWRDAAERLEALVREAASRKGQDAPRLPPPPRRRATRGGTPDLSILILNKDKPELLEPCVRSIEEHCDVPYEILIGDTGSTDPRTLAFYQTTAHAVHHLGFYQFSASNNVLAARARGRTLLFLNNDTKLIRTRFRDALQYLADAPSVGCVGGYLVYADHRIQHAGVRICRADPYRGVPEHFDRFAAIGGYPGLRAPRNVVAVTGAMLLVPAERFAQAGGFDEAYEEEAQDIDLCLRLRERGLGSVVHPALLAYHYENATRVARESPRDRAEFLRRFGPMIERELYPWQAENGLG